MRLTKSRRVGLAVDMQRLLSSSPSCSYCWIGLEPSLSKPCAPQAPRKRMLHCVIRGSREGRLARTRRTTWSRYVRPSGSDLPGSMATVTQPCMAHCSIEAAPARRAPRGSGVGSAAVAPCGRRAGRRMQRRPCVATADHGIAKMHDSAGRTGRPPYGFTQLPDRIRRPTAWRTTRTRRRWQTWRFPWPARPADPCTANARGDASWPARSRRRTTRCRPRPC